MDNFEDYFASRRQKPYNPYKDRDKTGWLTSNGQWVQVINGTHNEPEILLKLGPNITSNEEALDAGHARVTSLDSGVSINARTLSVCKNALQKLDEILTIAGKYKMIKLIVEKYNGEQPIWEHYDADPITFKLKRVNN